MSLTDKKLVQDFNNSLLVEKGPEVFTRLAGKKIFIVANSCWNIHNFRSNILLKLIELKAQIYILAPIDETIQYLGTLDGVFIIPLNNLRRNSSNPFSEFLLFREFYKKYKLLKPDFILHYTIKPNIYGSIAAGLLNIKSASVITGLGYTFMHKAWLRNLVSNMYKLAFRFNESVIFENQDDRILFINAGITKPDRSFSVKGCGVNVDYFHASSSRIDKESIEFIFVGRLLYDKGIKEYIDAAKYLSKKYKNAKFTVLGMLDEENPSHVSRDELVEWIECGAIQYYSETKDVRPFLVRSDCIVLPSYQEGLPKAIIEAMAMSLPVITTDTPGCRETVDENINGFLVLKRNTASLIEAIEKFINLSEGERYRMGQKSLQKVNLEFKDTTIAENILRIVARTFI